MRVLNLLLFVLLFSTTLVGQIEISPWEIHEGKEGVIKFVTTHHGDSKAYSQMEIPVDTDKGWKTAPKNAAGKVEISRSSTLKCNKELDFTYFQTEVSIPHNVDVNEFTISYDRADDGARIYFFNSKHSTGHFNPKADLKFQQKSVGSVNLKDEVVIGEVNRVVIVQFDDCGTGNNLIGINIKVNGKPIKEADGTVKDHCGNTYPTVTLGDQVWLEENLREPACGDCASIEYIKLGNHPSKNGTFYAKDGKPYYAYYSNNKNDKDPVSGKPLGALFNFAAIKSCNVCPEGFRIPTKNDWEILKTTFGTTYEFKKRDEANGKKPFTYMSGRADAYGSVQRGKFTQFWTSEEVNADKASAYYVGSGGAKVAEEDKRLALYVRCVKSLAIPVIPTNFKLHAYSTHGKRGVGGNYWMGWYDSDPTWGKIITDGSKAYSYMNIEKVDVPGEPGVVYLKVKNSKTADSYLTVDTKDGNKVKIKQGKSDNSKFRIKSPLQSIAKNNDYVSFESYIKPNFYIRHTGYKLYVSEATSASLKDKVFIEDASWLFQKL